MYPIDKFNHRFRGNILISKRMCGVPQDFCGLKLVFRKAFFRPKCSATQKRLGNTDLVNEIKKLINSQITIH